MAALERGRRIRGLSTGTRVIIDLVRLARAKIADAADAHESRQVMQPVLNTVPTEIAVQNPKHFAQTLRAVLQALRPAQWLKNGLVFAGLVFGGRLFDLPAVLSAVVAALAFCLLSSGFYLINDVKDLDVDRLHPIKRLRPVAAGELAPAFAGALGVVFVLLALGISTALGVPFFLVLVAYTALMTAYNLGVKQIVILDVFFIAAGFVLRAVGGAIAVSVLISPWLLICSMLLALLVGFGKRRHELVALHEAGRHRRNLDVYSLAMLDQFVAVTAAGTLIAYTVYTFDSESAQYHQPMMLTIPFVAYGVFRYLYLLYQGEKGGAPETMLLTDVPLLGSVVAWGAISAALFYFVG